MKDIILYLLLCIFITYVCVLTENEVTEITTPTTYINTYYPDCGIITSVVLPEGNEPWNSEVTFETLNGNLFSFYGGEDLEVNDVIAVIFDDKGTPNITDDEVVSVRYCSPVNVNIIE